MNRQQLTSVAVALACFLAVGVSATTLADTVSSSPSEAVDPNYDVLPIDGGDVADLQAQIHQRGDDADHRARQSRPDPGSGHASGGSTANSGGGGGGQSLVHTGWWGWLLALAAALALAYRYRDRIAALFESDPPPTPTADGGAEWNYEQPPADANAAYRAWGALIADVAVEDPDVRTTAETAAIARRAGRDEAAVGALRDAFEAVRYGGAALTDERRRRVREACRDLDLEPNGELP
ncbi:MAG: DUF4129 domain-containing protein [Haloarculaceae archaeon]